jgi:large subunit ribosomal protein L9
LYKNLILQCVENCYAILQDQKIEDFLVKELGMKVILNKDLSTLGEEGDVKDVAKGYARNYLFPRGIAMPYNEGTIKLFEARKGEIEARKVEKRDAAKGLKERLEALELSVSLPAGANGKLFGSLTSQTVLDELTRQGFQIERRRIELQGTNFKNVGKYKVTLHLYESASAELTINVVGQVEKAEEPHAPARGRGRRRPEESTEAAAPAEAASAEAAPAEAAAAPVVESAAEASAATPAAPEAAAAGETPA